MVSIGIAVVSIGISVVYQCFPVVYHWKSAVKFGGITSVMTNGLVVLPLLSTDITMEISGITTVLPLESTVFPVVIPPNFTTGFHWHTTGNTAVIPLVIPETFSMGKTYQQVVLCLTLYPLGLFCGLLITFANNLDPD